MIVRCAGRVVADKVEVADSFWPRFVGLMGRASLGPGEGLWLEPCSSIHMFFMRFPIDVVFLDRTRRVVKIIERMRPWAISPWVAGARSALELPAGAAGCLKEGDILDLS